MCQFECERLRCCSPVDGRYVSIALVPQTEERERGGGGEERVVVAVEERALFHSHVAEGFEPLLYSNALLPLSLENVRIEENGKYF